MKKIFTFAIVLLMGFGAMAQKNTLNSVRNLSERSYFNFHWGFNNWGNDPLSGLMGLSDEAYNLRTSFSSYQLSMGYNFVNTNHVKAGVGIGYESDVYKYNTPGVTYVSITGGDNYFMATTSSSDEMSTKLCTRYATLPLSVSYETKDNGIKVRLSAIPGLSFSGKHTGLKLDDGTTVKKYDLKESLNPYKLDFRVDVLFSGVGVFLQVATMPLMKDNFAEQLYPIKFGFVL